MRFVYFTDVHLCEGSDYRMGFEQCIASMLSHQPQVLVCGGDLGVTPEAVSLYTEMMRGVPVPVLLSNGNHEMCSGYLPREQAGTANSSVDIGGVHFVMLDVVRYYEPNDAHPWNWHALADEPMLQWLEEDLSRVDHRTPLVIASHVPVSTTFPFRMGQEPGMAFPTNEIANADRLLALLKPFAHVAALHGHDHENCRHLVDHIQILTTAAVAGNWWRNGLDSRCQSGREPQGYRLVEVAANGAITSRYIAIVQEQDEPAEVSRHAASGRRFVNVYDGSPGTRVEVEGLGALTAIDPLDESSMGLATHLYELPPQFDCRSLRVRVVFEGGRVHDMELTEQHQE